MFNVHVFFSIIISFWLCKKFVFFFHLKFANYFMDTFKSMIVTILNCVHFWSSFPCRIFLHTLLSLLRIVFILIHTTLGSVLICCTSAWEYLQPLHYLCLLLNPLPFEYLQTELILSFALYEMHTHTYLYTQPFSARLGSIHVVVCMRCEAREALKSQPIYSLLVRIKIGALKTYSFAFFPFKVVHILVCRARNGVFGTVRSIRDGIN